MDKCYIETMGGILSERTDSKENDDAEIDLAHFTGPAQPRPRRTRAAPAPLEINRYTGRYWSERRRCSSICATPPASARCGCP